MALTTSIITGRVPLPDDSAPRAGEIIFSLSGFDTEGIQVIPGGASRRYVLAADGSLPAGAVLWRNTGGLRGTSYRVTVRWSESDRRAGAIPREDDLGWVQVGSAASYTLPALLANPAGPAPGWYETVPRAAWEQVLALSGRVAAIEAPGWVTGQRMGRASVAPAALSPAVLDMLNGAGYAGLWTPASNFPGGAGGAAGRVWLVTAAGSRGGQAFTVGDRLVSLVANPSTTTYAGHWMRVQQHETIQSATDATAGRLLSVGAGGLLGTTITTSDLDTYTTTQFISAEGATLNRPSWALNWIGIHIQRAAGIAVQIMVSRSSTPTPSVLAWRRLDSGVWSAWERSYGPGSIVGTVTQASGMPTGAVIERGSNANGEYTRLADGTQICWGIIEEDSVACTTSSGGVWTTAAVRGMTWPAAFSAAPTFTANMTRRSGSWDAHVAVVSANNTGGSFFPAKFATGTYNSRLYWQATGRWF